MDTLETTNVDMCEDINSMITMIHGSRFFALNRQKITNFRKSKVWFVQFFQAVQMRPLWGSKGQLGSFRQFMAIFVKSKKRASAPSRKRIYVVSQILYQLNLKTQPDGTRCKKVIQDFNSTVIMLAIKYRGWIEAKECKKHVRVQLFALLKTTSFWKSFLSSIDHLSFR